VVVVAGAVEVRRHHAAVVGTVLAVVAFTEFYAGDFGYGVGLVRRLKHSGEQRILRHGLRCLFRVDAAGAEEEEFLHPVPVCGIDHIALDHQVLEDELGRVGVVGVDAADFRGGEVDLVRPFRSEELPHCCLTRQIQLCMRPGNDGGRRNA